MNCMKKGGGMEFDNRTSFSDGSVQPDSNQMRLQLCSDQNGQGMNRVSVSSSAVSTTNRQTELNKVIELARSLNSESKNVDQIIATWMTGHLVFSKWSPTGHMQFV